MFAARIQDLIAACRGRTQPVLTSFLSPSEMELVKQITPGDIDVSFYGGYENAERQVACIMPEGFEPEYDIDILYTSYRPVSRELTHRDVLGGLMHLGIDRSWLGDFIVTDNDITILCKESMSDFICTEFRLIGRCPVHFEVRNDLQIQPGKREVIQVNAASLRMDVVVAAISHCSRSKAVEKIRQGYVKLNDVVLEENRQLCNNDFVSIRQCGRFRFLGIKNTTRKDRLILEFEQYQ